MIIQNDCDGDNDDGYDDNIDNNTDNDSSNNYTLNYANTKFNIIKNRPCFTIFEMCIVNN